MTLRKAQYRYSDSEEDSLNIARNMILGKVHNQRYVIERARRDYSLRLDGEKLQHASNLLKKSMGYVKRCMTLDELRG